MECVYKVAVIAEICECCCLGIFQRIVTVLTVAVPLGWTVWMLGRKLAPESAIFRGNAGHDAPLPHHVPLPSHGFSWISLHSCCSFVLGWAGRVSWSLCWRHGFLLSLHPRGLQVSTRLRPLQQSALGWNGLGLRTESPWWHLSWAGPGNQPAYVMASLSWWAGVSLPGRAQALLLEVSILFSLHFQLSFFFNFYFKCPVLKLFCTCFMDDFNNYFISPAQEFPRKLISQSA